MPAVFSQYSIISRTKQNVTLSGFSGCSNSADLNLLQALGEIFSCVRQLTRLVVLGRYMTKFVVLIVKPSKNTQTQRCNNTKNVQKFWEKKLKFGGDTGNLILQMCQLTRLVVLVLKFCTTNKIFVKLASKKMM